jgi:acyl carrier protein
MKAGVEAAVRDYLAQRQQKLGLHAPLDAGTPLFEAGLLDSLALIELVSSVEAATGQTVDMLLFDPVDVESLADLVAELTSALQA